MLIEIKLFVISEPIYKQIINKIKWNKTRSTSASVKKQKPMKKSVQPSLPAPSLPCCPPTPIQSSQSNPPPTASSLNQTTYKQVPSSNKTYPNALSSQESKNSLNNIQTNIKPISASLMSSKHNPPICPYQIIASTIILGSSIMKGLQTLIIIDLLLLVSLQAQLEPLTFYMELVNNIN